MLNTPCLCPNILIIVYQFVSVFCILNEKKNIAISIANIMANNDFGEKSKTEQHQNKQEGPIDPGSLT